jgi:hypothetical protein
MVLKYYNILQAWSLLGEKSQNETHCVIGIIPKKSIWVVLEFNRPSVGCPAVSNVHYAMLAVTMVSRLFASRWCHICHPVLLQNAM